MQKYLKPAIILLALSGCVPAVIGGTGAGAYYAGTDKRDMRTIASDATITAEINTKYMRDDLISAVDVDVDTFEGKVTLIGHVKSDQARNRAIGIAESTKGVESVDSENLKVVE